VNAARYWHTVKYLRPSQILGRVWFHVYQPATDTQPAPARRTATRPWQPAGWRPQSQFGPDTVGHLNVSARIDDWNDASHGKLWLYHLHYFDDLTAVGCEERRAWHAALIHRWIAENRPAIGAGWDSYPTALRIANWIKWQQMAPATSAETNVALLDSLATQIRWLGKRLERHLLANHLWSNAKAMLAAGLFFEGPEADAWRRLGLDLVSAELDEQVLPDGGHFERSPMYHAIVLEDVLDVVQWAGVYPGVLPAPMVEGLRRTATRMLRWLRVMSHPDGQLSFFNDAAFGVASTWDGLAAYADALGVPVDRGALQSVEVLPSSGYVRLQNDRAVVLCDVAPVGPDYQPAHAHADTLSFELSLDGRRVLVNGGTSTYAAGPERDRQRGTAAHNTVEVDGHNSSDVWAGFRVARRARPFDVRSGAGPDDVWLEAAHDGYRHRPGQVVHRRAWRLDAGGLTVIDTLDGSYARATARFMLHPAAVAEDRLRVHCEPDTRITRARVEWHPEFGRSMETQTLEVFLTGPNTATHLRWS